MSIELDDEILQDFLVEAGELLEQLGEQLVELEQAPEDPDLLNAIFRNFHTIKGGAGFLGLTPLVAVCHKAEDIFNALRQGEKTINVEMMDAFLQVLDVVNEMFDTVRSGGEPQPADSSLLDLLQSFLEQDSGGSSPPVSEEQATADVPELESVDNDEKLELPGPDFSEVNDTSDEGEQATQDPVETTSSSNDDHITEEEFEELLDQLHGSVPEGLDKNRLDDNKNGDADAENSELITEDEFDNLLDEIHGKIKPKEQSSDSIAENETVNQEIKPDDSNSASINEDEFEDLLDQLHGKGKHQGSPKEENTAQVPSDANINKTQAKTATTEISKEEPKKSSVSTPAAIKSNKISSSKKVAKSNTPAAETTVRVDVQRLDDIMNMVGELVLVRNRLENLKISFDREQIGKSIGNLDVVTSDLQRAVMKTRMQPIKKVFGRFPRVVRDLARSLKKEIKLELRGEETDLDKNLVEALADPLIHLVRNAVDHGVESPEDRIVAGKKREGIVVLTASQEGDHIKLMIEDDGKGMNADKLRKVVVDKELMDEESAARLDDRECFNLIFMPGFSTKSEISDVSGRGVGMDVVKTRINQMNGSVDVDSVEGKGSKIIIKVPLTLAIMPTLMVKLDEQPFALPLVSVVEILDLDLNKTNVVDGQLVVMVRNRALPLFYLREWLLKNDFGEWPQNIGHVVVVNVGGRHVGFVVDHLIGQEEVVIKALGAKLQGLDGLSGATITGDGNIALILDVPSLMSKYAA